MNQAKPAEYYTNLVTSLCRLGGETEWVESKLNNTNPTEIGEYISALANGAALNSQPHGYLLWGIEDSTGQPIGTTFAVNDAKKGNEPLEAWLLRSLEPKIAFRFHTIKINEKGSSSERLTVQ